MPFVDTVVYDGDCGICEKSAEWIIRHVPSVSVKSHREYGVAELQSVWFITEARRFEGARAVSNILLRSDVTAMRLLGRFIGAPLIRYVAAAVYWVIARNRRHLSKLFGLKSCGIPQNPPR